jgi:hypothetical protein
MEDLSRAPALVTSLPAIAIKAITALLAGDLSQASDLFTNYQDAIGSKRSRYLLQCVIDDLRWLRGETEKLTQKQEAYMSTDWLELLFDADRKSRATRETERIGRIAKILCSSIRINPVPPADRTEEMMRIAMALTDDDVSVLRQIYEGQRTNFNEHLGRTNPEHANDFWRLLDPQHRSYGEPEFPVLSNLSIGALQGICAKLQSFGLLAQVERNNSKVSPGITPYALLAGAVYFMGYFRDSAE